MGIRPEFVQVVSRIYTDMCRLSPGEEVLIVTDSRTPDDVASVFMGVSASMRALTSVFKVPTPPPPSLQPSVVWPQTLAAAARKAKLIVDMSVGYADFMVEAVREGARIMVPTDGSGDVEDSLIRTMLAPDVHQLRREADHIAELLTQAHTAHITSEEGTDFSVDIHELRGDPMDGFLWDPDVGRWKATWACLPPAQPGIVLPPGRGDGIIAADGLILYAYDHETPAEPVFLTVEKGRVTKIGASSCATKLRYWLSSFHDSTVYSGPVHINIGTNPRAILTQHEEFERIRGAIDFGWGDTSGLVRLLKYDLEAIRSPVHWDTLIMHPTLKLDGEPVIENGVIAEHI